ncbi:MAG: Asp-tRNA(Asn)/Glu-tRNA(Gln) amidotransferase GatCAB subunit B, partial [Myxococcales bacterium]|nr:Asp-tRNA(Asn)/Glu-tRNA(Gln) amidotransferase GatCAB subunit B [Myxococcales bacterium]
KLGVRSELKNINSFRFVEEAIDVEIRRQIDVLETGGKLRQQTRGYASEKRETYLLRDKENDAGYRYFPDPDLPTLVIDELFVARMRRRIPELPAARRARYVAEAGLTPYAAQVLTGHPRIAAYFDECLLLASGTAPELEPVKIANFIQAELLGAVTTSGLDATFPVRPSQLVELLDYVRAGTISGKQAKEVYAAMAGTDRTAKSIIDERKLSVMSDGAELERLARDLVEKNPKQVTQYRAGKTQMLGFFVGQIMKATSGSANPALVNEILKRLLDQPS